MRFEVRNLTQGLMVRVLSCYLPTSQLFGLQLGLEMETLQIPAQSPPVKSKSLCRVTKTHQSKRLQSSFLRLWKCCPHNHKTRLILYQLTSAHFCCCQLSLLNQNNCNPLLTCSSVKSRSSSSVSTYYIQIFPSSFQSINTAAIFLPLPPLYDSVTRGSNCWRLIITKDSSWWFIKKTLFVHSVIKEQPSRPSAATNHANSMRRATLTAFTGVMLAPTRHQGSDSSSTSALLILSKQTAAANIGSITCYQCSKINK